MCTLLSILCDGLALELGLLLEQNSQAVSSTSSQAHKLTSSPDGNREVVKVCQVVLRQQRVGGVDTCRIRVSYNAK